jgi:hypothetical protein
VCIYVFNVKCKISRVRRVCNINVVIGLRAGQAGLNGQVILVIYLFHLFSELL